MLGAGRQRQKDVDCIRSGFPGRVICAVGDTKSREFFHARLGWHGNSTLTPAHVISRPEVEGSRPMLHGACVGNALSVNRVRRPGVALAWIRKPTQSGGITT